MTLLQKVVLGTPPTAVDGDTVRGANTKMNANVDVLSTQTALTSTAALIVAPQALTAAHVGTRVNINLPAAGTINLPVASTCAADQVIHLRNVGATLVTLAITTGSGDTIGLTTLAPGESAVLDTDGVHAWKCLMRGRSSSPNEVIEGTLTLAADPTAALQAATKQYADTKMTRGAGAINVVPVAGATALTATFQVVGIINFGGPAAGCAGCAMLTGSITFVNGAATTTNADALAYIEIFDTVANAVYAAGVPAIKTIQAGNVFNTVQMTVSVAASGLTPGRLYQARIQARLGASAGVATTVANLGIAGITF